MTRDVDDTGSVSEYDSEEGDERETSEQRDEDVRSLDVNVPEPNGM